MTTASRADVARIAALIGAPLVGQGLIKRLPWAMALAQRTHADRRAIDLALRLRARYGSAPLMLPTPGKPIALVLDPHDVHRVLTEPPDVFTPASSEKRAALTQFQPHAVLISSRPERPRRRAVNENVLEAGHDVHHLAPVFDKVVEDEFGPLTSADLDWSTLGSAWWPMVRRIVLGDHARKDTELTDRLASLRRSANLAWLMPTRRGAREAFTERLAAHLDAAEPGSLAATLAGHSGGDPQSQVPHWFFAFDAAAMVLYRALALLAVNPSLEERAREDAADSTFGMPFLRACVLESARLWPTTPAILRDSTRQTSWRGDTVPAGSSFVIFTPLFHRDPALPYADTFDPDIWLDGRAARNPALVPFSDGPAICPGRNLVQTVMAMVLARLVRSGHHVTSGPDLTGRLPAGFDPFGLRLRARTA